MTRFGVDMNRWARAQVHVGRERHEGGWIGQMGDAQGDGESPLHGRRSALEMARLLFAEIDRLVYISRLEANGLRGSSPVSGSSGGTQPGSSPDRGSERWDRQLGRSRQAGPSSGERLLLTIRSSSALGIAATRDGRIHGRVGPRRAPVIRRHGSMLHVVSTELFHGTASRSASGDELAARNVPRRSVKLEDTPGVVAFGFYSGPHQLNSVCQQALVHISPRHNVPAAANCAFCSTTPATAALILASTLCPSVGCARHSRWISSSPRTAGMPLWLAMT